MTEEQEAISNKEINNNPEIPELVSLQSLQSNNSLGVQHEAIDEREELQVVQNKSDKRINQEEIMRKFQEQLQREEKEREEIELRRMQSMKNRSKGVPKITNKKASQDDKKNNKENAQLIALSEKSNRIKRKIEDSCKKYKSFYRPSIYDTKLNRFRFQCKQKLFFYLCFGMEQMRDFSSFQLSEKERDLAGKDVYDYCRRVAFEIDLQMLKILNKNDRQQISRQYKAQWDTLLNHLKDDSNLQLKRKLLTKVLLPQKIAVSNQIQFYTTAKRQEILQKQKRYIAEFTVENIINPFAEKDNQEIMDRPRIDMSESVGKDDEPPTFKQQKSKYSNRYLDQSSILQLQQLLSKTQLDKMAKRLEQDLQGRSKAYLMANFKEVFHL